MVIKTPVPKSNRSISGIEPSGTAALGKFLIDSKLPGNSHTVSKNGRPPKMNIPKIIISAIMPAVDFFMFLKNLTW